MKLYYYVMDYGDGSCGVRWTDNEGAQRIRDRADNEENDDDGWWYAEETLTEIVVPEDFLLTNKNIRLTVVK